LQGGLTGGGHVGLAQVHFLQVGQAVQVLQALVADVAAFQGKPFQLFKALTGFKDRSVKVG
jgi:hypothetical protein